MPRDFLLFTAQNVGYAIPTTRVAEICKTGSIRALPNQKSPLMGVSFLRGKTMSMFDLDCLVNVGVRGKSRMFTLVLNAQKQHGSEPIGVLVDAVLTMVHASDDAIKPAPTTGSLHFSQALHYEDKVYWIIDDHRILSAIHSTLIAA